MLSFLFFPSSNQCSVSHCSVLLDLLFYLPLTLLLLLSPGCGDETNTPLLNSGTLVITEDIYRDEVWQAELGVYRIANLVHIPRGITLTIRPSTDIEFEPGTGLIVEGRLVVGDDSYDEGIMESEVVRFTTTNLIPQKNAWQGIYFENTVEDTDNLGSSLRGAIIEYAQVAIRASSSSLTVTDCVIRMNVTGLLIVDSRIAVTYTNVEDNGTGIQFEARGIGPQLENNRISDNEEGLVVMPTVAEVTIRHNDFTGNGEYAIHMASRYALPVPLNWWGTTVNEIIDTMIRDGYDGERMPGNPNHGVGVVKYQPVETVLPESGARITWLGS